MTDLAVPARIAPKDHGSTARMVLAWPGTRALIAVAALFLISPLIAPGSVGPTAIVSMLPFAALIAIVAIGQTLVIQQGGLDLSIPGAVTLGALIVARFGGDDSLGLPAAIAAAIVATAAFGLASGLVITLFGLPPLVVTIAVNALMIGTVQALSGGFATQSSDALNQFALSRWGGIPVLVFFALVLTLAVHVVLKLTRVGRRFELVGENPRSAANLGIGTRGYTIVAYVLSAALAAVGGVLLAGLLRTPTLTAGEDYLLPSIAAVVLGGTALTGGRGSVVGTALGALFLAQLTQLVQTFTQATAVQNIVQALIIGVGIVAQLQLGGSTSRIRNLMRRRPGA
ncbi:ribose transport system permease protein [Microbacterium hydrothermale]|uniref:ABC transporter permease n=1 Tax=Microbacterium hydrothermale TaxID=857427 RepID=UPI002227192C|nr:ABC transporter permease [Microbacterium hydrothermale]MCW2165811.1 ribose transport system permease protein [Microbacterium hydrothermale]